ncbi:hypothetical protein EWU23_11845 [Cytophagaceae bacterium 50C-KIRBA]|uniref:Uncharacterized protein n=1 Tax=Aquirufa beregesia TaxID=2516556 RepID=A0ABX0F0E7_9BACT|nr:hypothetical protein [Aquirufa beregesia]NGZ45168.1 hypothetical protein [Aquirufa beregesia]
MKKVSMFFAVLAFLVSFQSFSTSTIAPDFFAGKWELVIVGTPNGDAKMISEIKRVDGKLTALLKDPQGQNPDMNASVEEKENQILVFFQAQGMDITMTLNKVDDDNMKGDILSGMFEAKAKRIKE